MSNRRTYAIIGCGMMGREHMQNIALVPDAELIAIVEPDDGSRRDAKKLAVELDQTFGVFGSVDELFEACRPDAVIVASPNFTHYTVMRNIMEYGPAILVEKPFCTTVRDCEALEEECRAYGSLVWVGLEYRYMPPVTRFIEEVHSGKTGPLNMVYIREHRFPFLEKVGDWNRFSRNTGGTLVEKCCHFFDLMRHVIQAEPVRVFASGGQDVNHLDELYDGETPDILDNAYVVIEFENGTRAVLDLCMFAEGAEQQEEIYALGSVGRLDVAIPAAKVTWSPRDREAASSEVIDTPIDILAAGDHHGATYFQLQRFHRALVDGLAPDLTPQDGLRSVQMGAAAQESIVTGLPVNLDFNSNGGKNA